MGKPEIIALSILGAVLSGGGFLAGRLAQPARVEYREKVVEKTVEVATKESASETNEVRAVDIRTLTRWRIRVVKQPSGEVVTTASGENGSESAGSEAKAEAKHETQVVYRDKLVDHEIVKLVEARRQDWSLEARAGRQLTGDGSFVYSGAISRRIIGSLSAVVYASTARELGLGIRLEF